MTENEIKNTKKWFEDFIETYALSNQETIEFKKAVACLEEIQQYRAIGLTPELIEAMQGHNVALINDLGEYQAIGTVEEFKALKEKNEPEKPLFVPTDDTCLYQEYRCPSCNEWLADKFKPYRCKCGQKLDWE